MRIWVLSDLHLHDASKADFEVPVADVAVLAGDIAVGIERSIEWASRVVAPSMPVVLVAGNHEFYGRCHAAELAVGRAARRDGIHFLEDEEVVLDGVTFSGCTLWTDYCLDGIERRGETMCVAAESLNDHRLIQGSRGRASRFSPSDALSLHEASRIFLGGQLAGIADDAARSRHVVVTHHAPSPRSIARRFAGDPLNGAFASDMEAEIVAGAPAFWIHGHVHERKDYFVSGTRVVCNPAGYRGEVTNFDPALVLEI